MRNRMAVLAALVGICGFLQTDRARSEDADSATQVRTRGIIRTGVDRNGKVHGQLLKLTGLKRATSLNYKLLLLDKSGKEKPVDEKETTFEFGQQFRIEIEADSDMYLYVFHEGPGTNNPDERVRTILVPDEFDDGRVPQVKKGQKIVIPDDGTYFEFVPPPGQERLLVYATPEKKPELTPQEAFEEQEKLDQKKAIELKSKQDAAFRQTKSKEPKKTITASDPRQVAQLNSKLPEFRLRGLRWEPVAVTPDAGKTVLAGSYDEDVQPELYVEISLRTK